MHLVPIGKIKPTTLENTLDAILQASIARIIKAHKGRQYRASDEIRGIEDEIDRLYRAVLSGQASISDFQNAVNVWERRTI